MWLNKSKNPKEDILIKTDDYILHVKLQDKNINKYDDLERLIHISKNVRRLIKSYIDEPIDFYFEEAIFSYGKSNTISQYATLIKYNFYISFFHVLGKPLYNNIVKKTIIGKGNAKKHEVIDHLMKKDKLHYELTNVLTTLNLKLSDGSFFEDLTDSYMMSLYVQQLKGE
jgi:Holliday junction resolvasome RuvABC endonuclease subunit